jgi:hypothetical protein
MRCATLFSFLFACATCAALGCSSSTTSSSSDANVDASNGDIVCHVDSADAGACNTTITSCTIPDQDRTHVAQGTDVAYPTNPPCGGHHYPVWIEWGVHTTPVPTGNWVHNLEHGGVAFLYRCASHDACPAIATQLEALAAAVPEDPECAAEGGGIHARVLVIPDPDLPPSVQVAAAAWGYSLDASCVDTATLNKFYSDHVGNGPEDLCFQGAPDPTDAGVSMDTGDETSSDAAPDGDASDGG